MDNKVLKNAFGILSFVVAMVVYLMTVQPTVPFWDCGEFSAATIWQQVPHPPGAPLFLMIGKIFHLLIPFGDPGWRVNLASVFSSAFTVWLLYLITVMVIKNFRKEPIESLSDALMVYGSAFVGAVALIFSDTFWFNAVESEVYAMSTLFVAVIVYLMMRWNEEADNPGHERYLLLIAYLMGLSTGVHLLALLAVFSIVFLVYFRKYKFSISSFMITGIVSVIIFFILYPGIVKWVPTMLAGNLPFKNKCHEYLVSDSPFVTFLAIGSVILAGIGLWYGIRNKRNTLNLICSSFLLMIFGYSTYTQILIRSNANPPMNENEPRNLSLLTAYLGREQYGEAPNWPRRYQVNDDYYISRYNKKDPNGEFVYGEWIQPVSEPVECKNDNYMNIPQFKETNFSGEMNYLTRYQIYHMYIRYFLWNFVGRLSDIQDSEFSGLSSDQKEADEINAESGYAQHFPVKFWALPLLFGIFGLIYHFNKDKKTAFLFLTMFLMMGLLAAIAQNQQEPQPRERDYFYSGSFLIFCMWIGIAPYAIIDSLSKVKNRLLVSGGVVAISLLLVPFIMAKQGWMLHSRAGNFIPFDYSYNILQSCDKDAIIFTNGDNDTFPLWYLQDVAGVRRDVRIVNLSLGNTLWYIDQLKNRSPWGAKKIPLSFSDDSLRVSETDPKALSYELGMAMQLNIPIKPEIMKKYTNDPNIYNSGIASMEFVGKPFGQKENKQQYLYRVQDKLVLNILQNIRWERPVYYSVTVGPDAFCGLEEYFRSEGMAMRICPVKQKTGVRDAIDVDKMEKCLMNIDNSDNFHTEQHYGFKLRNLNNKSVFYDEVHRRLMLTYRTLYITLANEILEKQKNSEKAVKVLDIMNKNISPDQFPINFESLYEIANTYDKTGFKDKAKMWINTAIKETMRYIENPRLNQDVIMYEMFGRYFGPFSRVSELYAKLGNFNMAREILERQYMTSQEYKNMYSNNPQFANDAMAIEYSMNQILGKIVLLKYDEVLKKNGEFAALDTLTKLKLQYSSSQDPKDKVRLQYVENKLNQISKPIDTGRAVTQKMPVTIEER